MLIIHSSLYTKSQERIVHAKIYKKVLKNGLTVLVLPRKKVPKVSIQLFYNVGSKNEKSGEKGIAHLIEHMIFKGTQKLSESDINLITHKLSGYCNAFTSFDYTGYVFDFPTQHAQEALPIMADCMENCAFKEQLLNSELKAVIQELKMYNDDYVSSLIEAMLGVIFEGHPYHYPIIGYKQDLWSVKRDTLLDFYKKYYIPNNATLVGVGDIEPEQFFKQAEEVFGHLKPNYDFTPEEHYWRPGLGNKSVTIYRDIQQPFVVLSWVIPGMKEQRQYIIDQVSWIIGSGDGSRLYKKLVHETQLATNVETFTYDLFDHGLFFVYFQPQEYQDIGTIINLINQELINLAEHGPSEQEMVRASKKTEADFLSLFENNQKLGYLIGQTFLATNNDQFVLEYINPLITATDIQQFIARYLRPAITNQGAVMPIALKEKPFWLAQQQLSDQEDTRILSRITREQEVEPGVYVDTIEAKSPSAFNLPKKEEFSLPNGLKVLYHNNNEIPKINLILDFSTKYYDDPVDKSGIGLFLANLLLEGTKNYSASQLADLLESRGISISSDIGYLSMSLLSADLSYALTLLNTILTESILSENSIEKVRAQMLAEVKNFMDDARQVNSYLTRKAIYGDHPYGKLAIGTEESISKITRKDLLDYYQKTISPKGARLAIVGDVSAYNLQEVVQDTLGSWQGHPVTRTQFPVLKPITHHEINYPMNRDQIVLSFGGLSVDRKDPRYLSLLVFDQIFTGGVLRSMSSRLFELRERSGLFYTIGGSIVLMAEEQPGMVLIKTIVSTDRLKEAEQAIAQAINTATDSITTEEFVSAQRALVNSLVDTISTNKGLAGTYLWLDQMGFGETHFSEFIQAINKLTPEEVAATVKPFLDTNKLVTVRVGRI